MNAIVSEKLLRMPDPCPTITTRRLVLRPHRRTDADAITQSMGDFQVVRMLARVPLPYDRQDALDWLSKAMSGATPDWCLAITTGDDIHIGVVAIELRHGQWRIGYWLNRCYWSQGFMSEAASATIERFFRHMPDAMLHSGAFADNGASLRIQAKLGFAVIGSGHLYSLSRNAMAPHIDTRLVRADFRPA
mgnify:CR=1 FL=1|jgi:Acetyltransferases, including N-acetylases of ribosomal proteins